MLGCLGAEGGLRAEGCCVGGCGPEGRVGEGVVGGAGGGHCVTKRLVGFFVRLFWNGVEGVGVVSSLNERKC